MIVTRSSIVNRLAAARRPNQTGAEVSDARGHHDEPSVPPRSQVAVSSNGQRWRRTPSLSVRAEKLPGPGDDGTNGYRSPPCGGKPSPPLY